MGRVVALIVSVLWLGCGLTVDLTPPRDAAFDAARTDAGVDTGRDATPPDDCRDDADCDFGECTIGRCNPDTNRCEILSEVDCARPDACNVFLGCSDSGECLYELIDDDGDGHAARDLGACGTDCDDSDETVSPEGTEICDAIDQDCDDIVDETVGTLCAEDLDMDGFGSAIDFYWSCDGSCPDNTVSTSMDDCWDAEDPSFPGIPGARLAHPGQSTFFDVPRDDDTGSFDWNCDGLEEPNVPDVVFETCTPARECRDQSGWGTDAIPGCGERGEYTECRSAGAGFCEPVRINRTKFCR